MDLIQCHCFTSQLYGNRCPKPNLRPALLPPLTYDYIPLLWFAFPHPHPRDARVLPEPVRLLAHPQRLRGGEAQLLGHSRGRLVRIACVFGGLQRGGDGRRWRRRSRALMRGLLLLLMLLGGTATTLAPRHGHGDGRGGHASEGAAHVLTRLLPTDRGECREARPPFQRNKQREPLQWIPSLLA